MAGDRIEADPDCRLCHGDGWVEVAGEGWARDNERCSCTEPAPSRRASKRTKHQRTHFNAIAHIIDDCLTAGVLVYCVRMPKKDRDKLLDNLKLLRRRSTRPEHEASILGVPVVEDDRLAAKGLPYLVVTDETAPPDRKGTR